MPGSKLHSGHSASALYKLTSAIAKKGSHVWRRWRFVLLLRPLTAVDQPVWTLRSHRYSLACATKAGTVTPGGPIQYIYLTNIKPATLDRWLSSSSFSTLAQSLAPDGDGRTQPGVSGCGSCTSSLSPWSHPRCPPTSESVRCGIAGSAGFLRAAPHEVQKEVRGEVDLAAGLRHGSSVPVPCAQIGRGRWRPLSFSFPSSLIGTFTTRRSCQAAMRLLLHPAWVCEGRNVPVRAPRDQAEALRIFPAAARLH